MDPYGGDDAQEWGDDWQEWGDDVQEWGDATGPPQRP
jgi:hypothetical protein